MRGRILLFAAPGTAQRLPALLDWMGAPSARSGGEGGTSVPALLCHGTGDAVTVPPLHPRAASEIPAASTTAADGSAPEDVLAPTVSRWLVAPDVRNPWLPGPDVLLWACLRVARAGGDEAVGEVESAARSGLPALIPQ